MSGTHGVARSGPPTVIGRPLHACPACGSIALEPVVELEAEDVHFLCTACSRCWHVELGYVHRMQPRACHGCAHREQCVAAWNRDHAS